MRIRVEHDLGDLARDLETIPRHMLVRGRRAVAAAIDEGVEDTKRIAQAASGPHGSNYFKRVSGELTGPLSGEYGPHAPKTRYVGVSGPEGAMRDLNKSADRAARRLQKRAGLLLDGLFWP